MKPYGSKRSFDTEPRIKNARALVKREGEDIIEEQMCENPGSKAGVGQPVHVPRNERPSRKLALRALERYLERHPDLRIGQAIQVVTSCDSFYVEDDELAAMLDGEPLGADDSCPACDASGCTRGCMT